MAAQSVPWTRQHTLSAFHLYTLLPFGKLHQHNAEIKQLASWQGRTPSSLAMKLVNFASLDPQITGTGRSGLSGASSQDRALWAELQRNWDKVANEAADAYAQLALSHGVEADAPLLVDVEPPPIEEGKTRSAIVQVRVNQARFRKAVLASYDSTCCISGLRHERLLIASHIVPWSQDTTNRLNPQNGLCLSALHDKAYDLGLITVMPNYRVKVSSTLRPDKDDSFIADSLLRFDNTPITLPKKLKPGTAFLEAHARRFGFL
ncbi:HNH endonuclease [soil metagenome]